MVAGPGANAGVITSGQLAAMAKTQSFPPDTLYIGTSVGAFAWLYTLVGEDYRASTVFGQHYCDNRFFSPYRLLTKRPSLNLDYVLNDVTRHRVPLPYNTAETSPHAIHALTTSATGTPHLLPLTGVSEENIQQALRATASMPYIGRTHNLQDTAGWDGWLMEPHLLAHLQSMGITDVIWFTNYKPKTLHQLPRPARLLWAHIIRKFARINPIMATVLTERLATNTFLQNPPSGMRLEVMEPPIKLSPTSRNPRQIFHALGTSYRAMATYLGHPNLPYPTEWAPWQHHMPLTQTNGSEI